MTVKLSVSLPDDVAAFLQQQGNVSAYVTDRVREQMPEARRARMREAVRLYSEGQKLRSKDEIDAEAAMNQHQIETLPESVFW